MFYDSHKNDSNKEWIQTPVTKPFGGHLAIMRSISDDIVLVIVAP